MCYSNSSTSSNETLGKIYTKKIDELPQQEPCYFASGFTYPEWRIVTKESSIRLMKWGLIPRWFQGMEPKEIANKTLNARVETLHEKVSFNSLLNSNRCIIPSNGFFEFQHHGSNKIPYFIYPTRDQIFSMAGLYDEWVNRYTGEFMRTFTIITTEANELMAEIHNQKKRMPLLLDANSINDYLARTLEIPSIPVFKAIEMNAHRVDKGLIFSNNPNTSLVQHPFVDNIENQTRLF
jgi:putative SOS response-associated peptidase YedK